MANHGRDTVLDILPTAGDKSGPDAHIEDSSTNKGADSTGLSYEDRAFLEAFTDEQKKKVVRKIDVRLIPLLTLLYLFSFIDRANIGKPLNIATIYSANLEQGNAKIEGLTTDLKLNNAQYNTCLSIFFVPYILFGEFLNPRLATVH